MLRFDTSPDDRPDEKKENLVLPLTASIAPPELFHAFMKNGNVVGIRPDDDDVDISNESTYNLAVGSSA